MKIKVQVSSIWAVAAMHYAILNSYFERCTMYYPCRLPVALQHLLNSGAITANTYSHCQLLIFNVCSHIYIILYHTFTLLVS